MQVAKRVRDLPQSGGNSTLIVYPDACVHELFEQQVARNPEAVAVIFKNQQVSYQELNLRANQVAHYVRQHGVGPESLVGVCIERSPEMVIALLGVWKAGGAYVPLDSHYPRERLEFMARDAGLNLLLTDDACGSLFRSADCQCISLESCWATFAQESTCNLNLAADPSSLAYVIYTSGSTGEPKGAMIEHRGLVNYLWWAMQTYPVDASGPVPIHSSIAYDSTVASLYPPLLAGGKIELLPEEMGAQGLLAALRREKSRAKVVITPSHLELLSGQLGPEEMAGATKTLVVAGETLSAERLSRWRDLAPATRLFNEYGPTETTVGCCAYEVPADNSRNGAVPIGQPIANMRLYVLDGNLRPVPPGSTGELYVGGIGVARGYLNRPQLTREKFLVDPFSEQSGSRLYRTGDLGRYREDGVLECLGRADNQVKLRGYRIELGEIEATLAGFPGVRSCAVLARENTLGNKHLVGYVVAGENETLEPEALRKFLRQRLPEYMVPGQFVFLDRFPLTRNGKVDRKALPAPPVNQTLDANEFIAPRTETEKKLAAIWMELLKAEHIGIHDDFFELGGDSLLAVNAMLQIQEKFGTVLSMQTFFPSATIAGLASALTGRKEYWDRLAYAVPVQPNGEEPPFCWIGAGAQARPLSAQIGSNQPFFDIEIGPTLVDQPKAPLRMEEIAKHLVLALREKQPRGPYRLGGFCLSAVFAYEVARQLIMDGQDVGLLILVEPLYPRQSARVRLVTGLRRMIIRVGFHFEALRRLRVGEFPVYARSRWKGLKYLLTDMLWRFSARSPALKRQFGSPDLDKILFFAASSYEPKPLGCPTVIFRCKDWPILSAGDPYFGWRELLTGRSETHEVPGDHEGIFHEPSVQILAEKLRTCLDKAKKR